MERPAIIDYYDGQINYEISLAKEKGEDLEYYTYFIQFLEQRIESFQLHGDPGMPSRFPKKFGNTGVSRFGIPQMEYGIKYLKSVKADSEGKSESLINGTTKQSTLAIYYMQKALKFPRTTGVTTEDAAFVKFLIGKDFDEIRKLLADPIKRPDEKTGKATQSLIKDLTIVLNQFKKIQFFDGVKLIENDLDKLQNDLKTFNPV